MQNLLFISVTIAAILAGILLLLGADSAHVVLTYAATATITFLLLLLFPRIINPRSAIDAVLRREEAFAPLSRHRRPHGILKPYSDRAEPEPAFGRMPVEHYPGQLDLPRIACVGCWRSAVGGNIAEQLFRIGHAVDNCENLELVISILTYQSPDRWRCLVVNVDGLLAERSLESIFECLIIFRKHVHDIPVLLIWRDLSRDELGTNRHVVADASLASPVTQSRLKEGLIAAQHNNTLWRNRRQEQSCNAPDDDNEE